MARKAPAKRTSRGRQDHPTGPLETVDDDWKADVLADMKTLGWDQKKLHEKISISEGAISRVFSKPGPVQIRWKGRVHEALGWSTSAKVEEAARRVMRAGRRATDAELDLYI